MKLCVLGKKPLQNAYCFVAARLVYVNFLKTADERTVFFKITRIFLKRRRADNPDFSAGKHRLKKICGIHIRIAVRSCAHYHMNFINKKNGIFLCHKFVKDGVKALFKITAEFCTGNQKSDVKAVD